MSTETDDARARQAPLGTPSESVSPAYRVVIAAGLLAIVMLFGLAGVLWLLKAKVDTEAIRPEVALAIVVLITVVVLTLSMATLTVVFERLGLHDPKRAMGLPSGSIRAIIAVLLIVLFLVLSVFMFSQLNERSEEGRELIGVSAEVADAIPIDEMLSRVPSATEPGAYDLVLATPSDRTVEDFAKQLLTTMSTLVVAIAAFYFGANSVDAAHKAARQDETNEETRLAAQVSDTGVVVAGVPSQADGSPSPAATPGH